MLGPRDIDISALFLFFVALPLVAYFLLGKWSEVTKRKNRISLISKSAVEEALPVEDMAVGCVIPMASVQNNAFHHCARCFGAATTRCSHCKSVWYCSGGCQITHWRQVHKLECHQLGNNCQISSLTIPTEGSRVRISADQTTDPNISEFNVKHPSLEKNCAGDIISPLRNPPTYSNGMKIDKSGKHVSRRSINKSCCSLMNGDADQEIMFYESGMVKRKSANSDETKGLNCFLENTSMNKAKATMHSRVDKLQKSAKSAVKMSKCDAGDSSIPLQENNLVANLEIRRTMDLPKSVKLDHQHSEDRIKKQQKVQMLFPYEEFVKCFQLEVLSMSPRGLVNCGNSCYANAVLQCLTSTKPLIIYLHRQSHSRAGCDKAWCLMCELERHVMMLQESGYPLSPGKVLMYIRSLNSQIGDGSQEDAHEFLRLIIASLQSICLERLGGEKAIDPWLQNTTFVQHTFGGLLRSKVKCLRCHHESERRENIMDLTLEIFGRVESLEDALTQFTSSEDLDGDNMYRCGRCASYVRARKQLSIMEAPNILTIVLKRFQEGNYGKINKCIRFPEMLDMIPFMTGTDDIPPLYMLYAVVVHLNKSNSSFSGHYISYVKDLSGNWFKIDDTEVQPVRLNEVMSEGAYILFYMRSYPRPARAYGGRVRSQQSHTMPKQCSSKLEKSSEPEQSQLRHNFSRRDPLLDHRGFSLKGDRSRSPITSNCSEFTDATSSDWSLFTSSDDASFTTESTIDSFSVVDYPDSAPFSSIFQSLYPSGKPETRFAHEEKGYVSASYLTIPPSRDWRGETVRRADILPTAYLYNSQKSIPS
ncbi:ubiquitin carboxyl-terminal hydrolase 15-like [Primulina tabacum]|uniref:ubiquitin carboxyl-terminal hydrolase 15-like n=1 Tax=Primulina tabacum TaxID=48773 RepID=UPI003F5984CE